jgi:hypothetical protein
VVAGDVNLTDFDLGALIHHERQRQRTWGALLHLRIHGGVLMAALGFVLFDHRSRMLHAAGIVLLLHRQPDFALFEAVQNFRFADGLIAT